MKLVAIIVLFCLQVCVNSSNFTFEEEWQAFKNLHRVSYRSPLYENNKRNVFEQNIKKVKAHNVLYERGMKSYKLGISPFADLTSDEYKALLNLKNDRKMITGRSLFKAPTNVSAIPKYLDWRTKGAVTPVKDQGFCGSCWAFAATGAIEAQYFLKSGKLVPFSEQELVDCAEEYGGFGCMGGYMSSGFQYIKYNGIEEETNYPYQMYDNECRTHNLMVTKITDYYYIQSFDEDALLAAVATIGPVAVGIDASDFDFQFYDGGIYDGNFCSRTRLNHAVLIVGYGSSNGVDYWIVKNSWGRYYGADGYIYMKRGVNQCGISLVPIFGIL